MKRELQNPGLRASDQARYMAERPATVLSVRIRKVGDCFSATDDGYYIDCDGCAYNAASATLDAQTGTLYFDDPNGVGIAGTEVEGFAAPTARQM